MICIVKSLRIALLLVILILVIEKTFSQCTINAFNNTSWLNPSSLSCITPNVSYGQQQQIYIPDIAPGGATIDSVIFTGISGLPSGINFSINPANGVFTPYSRGCIWISGTTTITSGSFPLTFAGNVYTSSGIIPLSSIVDYTVSICPPFGCVIDSTNTSPGLTPASPPCVAFNAAYGETQQIYIPATVSGGNGIDSVIVTGITGLPSGINYNITPADGVLPANSHGCIWFSGIDNSASGIFPLTISGYIYTHSGILPISALISDTMSICSPRATASFSASNTTPCIHSVTSFSNNSVTAPTGYSWYFPGGTPSFSSASNPSVVYDSLGNYSVTLIVYSAGGSDTLIRANYIQVSPAPTLNVSTTPSACGQSAGTAVAVTTGVIGAASYVWSNSGTADTIRNLIAGPYTVTMSTSLGCTVIASGIVSDINGPVISFINQGPSCYLSTDGKVTANISGGTSPYTYAWSIGNSVNDSLTGIGAGTYNLTVTDHNGCINIGFDTLSQPNIMTDQISTIPSTGSNGVAWANPSGGTPPYTYRWSNNATIDTISGLAPGIYTITVTDAHGCTDTMSGAVNSQVGIKDPDNPISHITIAPNPANDEVVINVISSVDNLSQLTVVDMLGRTPINQSWYLTAGMNGKIINVSNLAVGIYNIVVRFGNVNTSKRLVVLR